MEIQMKANATTANGVTATHYELVSEALLWTLERALGKASGL
jgi:hemoglobin-like flavoprotein